MADFMVVPDTDHGFFRNADFKESFGKWGKPGNEFNPEILKIMKDWIGKQS